MGSGSWSSDTSSTSSSQEEEDRNYASLSINAPVPMDDVIENFKDAYPKYRSNDIYVDSYISEEYVGQFLAEDNSAMPDILLIADDNLRMAAEASAILPLGEEDGALVLEEGGQQAVDAVSFPLTRGKRKKPGPSPIGRTMAIPSSTIAMW